MPWAIWQHINKNADSYQGYHKLDDGTTIEVWWHTQYEADEEGWYWWACQPGCLPDGDPVGPFTSSYAAYANAERV